MVLLSRRESLLPPKPVINHKKHAKTRAQSKVFAIAESLPTAVRLLRRDRRQLMT